MAEPSLSSLMSAITTALNAAHSTAPYDFSATGAVRRGRYTEPPRVPFACVAAAAVQSDEGPVLGRYRHTATIDVVAWAAATAADLDTRVQTCEQLASYLMAALHTARATPGNALRDIRAFRVSLLSVPGDIDPIGSDTVAVVLVIELQFDRTSGLSG